MAAARRARLRARQSVSFTEPQREWLEAECDRTGLSVSEIVRRAVDEHRHRLERPPSRPPKAKGGDR